MTRNLRHAKGSEYLAYTRRDIDHLPALQKLPASERLAMKAVSAVYPFRVNNYIVEELIHWNDVPNDPMFQLTFPQRGMLEPADFERMVSLVAREARESELQAAADDIRRRANPQPSGQQDLNVPRLADGSPLAGVQHKYRETVLFFPSQGQTCHGYCTYCFRWAQFVGWTDVKFASKEVAALVRYLEAHREVTNVLFTGGDPMIMRADAMRRYVEPLLQPSLAHLSSVRFGTKAPAFWPQRFVSDSDADEVLRLFDDIVATGRHVAVMLHSSHPRELEAPIAQEAIRRIRDTGAIVRCQAPLIRGVNDDPEIWATLWQTQVQLGAIPYYMFVERDTGPRTYFAVPLARCIEIFNDAVRKVPGLARTVRGPSMSTTAGKVVIDGVTTVLGQAVFVLRLLQARDPDWVGVPFFAQFDARATWLDELKPAFGEKAFFFEPGLHDIERAVRLVGLRKPRLNPA